MLKLKSNMLKQLIGNSYNPLGKLDAGKTFKQEEKGKEDSAGWMASLSNGRQSLNNLRDGKDREKPGPAAVHGVTKIRRHD